MVMMKGEKYETTSLALYRLYCFPNQIFLRKSGKQIFLNAPRKKSLRISQDSDFHHETSL